MPIKFEKVDFTYSPKTPFAFTALKDISVSLKEKEITAIVGNTGSGKSTLIQHLNALLLPTSGKVEVLDFNIEADKKFVETKNLRKRVGLVFQFPEYQLFEETILKDVMYGPINFGDNIQTATTKAINALALVGIDKSYYDKSPLEISGGEKRKIAIAGILAMSPDIIVLDEPVAGLDPQSAGKMMALFVRLNKEFNKTIILVSHNMEHVLTYCQNVVVVKDGQIIHTGTVREFFTQDQMMDDLHIAPPMIIKARRLLEKNGFDIPDDVLTIEELAKTISKAVRK